jgi:nicotinamidase-related amidase
MKTPSSMSKLELCNAKASQLIVVDVQDRLSRAMPHDCLAPVLQQIGRLVDAARALAIPVITTRQYPQGLGPARPELTDHLPPGAEPVDKTCFSCCSASGFERMLAKREGRPQIVLAGLECHICVLQTAAGLQHWGYRVFVAGDAVCSRTPAHRANALERMRDGGIIVTNTESVVFEWLGDATHPQFKELSRMFR